MTQDNKALQRADDAALARPNTGAADGHPNHFRSIFAPPDRKAAMDMCVQLSRERWLPESMRGNPMFIAIALSFGEKFGLEPMSALTNIAIINGKPSLYGPLELAVCRRVDPGLQYSESIQWSGDGDKRIAVGCEVVVTRTGCKPHTEVFTKAEADRAGLWGKKGPWSTYPQRMLMARARSFALRTVYPDVLAGFIGSEEAEDYPSVQEQRQQRRASRQDAAIKPHPASVVDAEMFDVKHNASQNETPETSGAARDRSALAEFMKAIDAAKSSAQLAEVAKLAANLSDDDRAMSRDIFRTRQQQLRIAEKEVVDTTVANEHHSTFDDDRRKATLDRIMSDDDANLPTADDIPTPEDKGWE